MIFELLFFSKFENILQTRLVFSIHVSTYLLLLVRTFQIDKPGQFQLNQFGNYSQKNLQISGGILIHSSKVLQLASFLHFFWHEIDIKTTLL